MSSNEAKSRENKRRHGVSDDVHWNIVGKEGIQGKTNLEAYLLGRKAQDLSVITVHHVVTHG